MNQILLYVLAFLWDAKTEPKQLSPIVSMYNMAIDEDKSCIEVVNSKVMQVLMTYSKNIYTAGFGVTR